VSDPKWLAKAEELAGPHEPAILGSMVKANGPGRRGHRSCDYWIDYNIGRCNCPRRERVQAIALALEAERAAGRTERMELGADFLLGVERGIAAGREEGKVPDFLDSILRAFLPSRRRTDWRCYTTSSSLHEANEAYARGKAEGRREGVDTVEKFFLALRFNAANHLGLGDVRVTLGQQDELITLLRALPPKDPK